MATRLNLYNAAIRHIKGTSLTALTDTRPIRYVLDNVWDTGAVDFVLAQAYWKFACRTVKLEPDPSVTPSFGYSNAFEKPTDLVRIAAVCEDEYLNFPLLQYTFEHGYWYADHDEIYIQYVSNDASYGNDLVNWPVKFTKYVELYLATEICGRGESATNDDFGMLAKRMEKALNEAKSDDAMQGPTKFMPPGSWTQSRGGGGSRNDRGNRGGLIG